MLQAKSHIFPLAAGLCLLISCSNPDSKTKTQPAGTNQRNDADILDDWYSNPEYDLALGMPASWVLVEEPLPEREHKVINLYKKAAETDQELQLNIHSDPKYSYITIWPGGIGTELPPGEYASFNRAKNVPELSFTVDSAQSKILQLDGGTAWAYFIVPENPPESWSDSGFIFAQIQISNHKTSCFDEETGEELAMKECNFMTGDRFVRKGTINEQDAAIIHRILNTISLEEVRKKEAASDMIEIENPAPGMDISSPLTIKGEAKGHWYYEGIFTIKLYDASDRLLAETTAEADGEWMTEQFVPFETTISFEASDDQRGRLVFERANPSGLPQNDQSHAVPVVFSNH